MTTTFEEIESIDDISPFQFPEADYGSLVHLIELKKIEAFIDIRDQNFEYAKQQWEIRVKEFERRKYFFMMFYCAIASVVGAMVFWGLSGYVCR